MKPEMVRDPMPHEVSRFRKACRDPRKLVDAGWFLYLDAGGGMNLMRGPSHDDGHRARQDRIVESEPCGADGGDW